MGFIPSTRAVYFAKRTPINTVLLFAEMNVLLLVLTGTTFVLFSGLRCQGSHDS